MSALQQMADTDQYRKVYTTEERHPCPVPGCRISAEEHHRLMYGILMENRELKRKLAAPVFSRVLSSEASGVGNESETGAA